MKHLATVFGILAVLVSQVVSAEPATLDKALIKEANAGIKRGVEFLVSKQMPNGAWIGHPAITALACMAIMEGPEGNSPKFQQVVDRGLDFVVSQAHDDGSIWNKETEKYPNYSTSISLIALALRNRSKDKDLIRKARDFLLGSQFSDIPKSNPSYGGIGYGKRLRPDLSNTQWALEALYVTDHFDREPHSNDPEKAKKADLAWDRAIEFLSSCQNLAETNDAKWVLSDPDNKGGFIYLPNPAESKAGEHISEGKRGLRSYGSMTYAGLKSMIYAKLDRDDPRVKAAIGWVQRHYTFEENPGVGLQGLYYYLHTMAKALAAFDQDVITDEQGKKHNWREELVRHMLQLQKPEGQWANENARWFESMPELVTPYALLTIEVACGDALSK